MPLEPVGLHSASVVDRLREIDDSINPLPGNLVVQIPGEEGWIDLDPKATIGDSPVYRLVARYNDGEDDEVVTVLNVDLALTTLRTPYDILEPDSLYRLWTETFGFDWPFRQVSFDASPYVLSTMVIGRADESLSSRELDRAKGIMDAHLDAAPSAATDGLVWPRRLNGPIQYSCYVLFFAGLIFIALHWISNILPNRLLKGTKSFRVEHRLVNLDPSPAAAEPPTAGDASPDDPAGEQGVSGPEKSTKQKREAYTTIAAPWHREGDRADLDRTILEMEAIRESVTRKANFLWAGAVPALPRLDAWISGLLAMKSARSGENVPSFVSTEIDAAADRLEAHHRILSFIVWAIPTLGFIGTVIGIGSALLATVDLGSGEAVTRLRAESSVAVEIGVAFDTTLVALALSFVLMMALHLLQHLEESMLAEEKHDTLRALVQIENILPDDPIKELRDGLAQMGLSAAQIERWTDILDHNAHKFRETMDLVEDGLAAHKARENGPKQSSGSGRVLAIAGFIAIVMVAFWWGEDIRAWVSQIVEP
ncbi:MotA/TolQ/ExbB proton channel family protein [Paracoccus sp. TD-10]|uniref:MotA/TolQ/ExbB proton channel family protein n=1 Tax=Paracoccus sp. TD-10 TaxID=3395918 RepID=UPI003AB09A32